MAEKMMAYIRSQPNVWREVYEKREQRLGEFCRAVSDLAYLFFSGKSTPHGKHYSAAYTSGLKPCSTSM